MTAGRVPAGHGGALGELKGHALLLVDAVTSIGGIELRADDGGVDLGCAGTQKCLGLELSAAEGHRLPELTPVRVPEGVDSARA